MFFLHATIKEVLSVRRGQLGKRRLKSLFQWLPHHPHPNAPVRQVPIPAQVLEGPKCPRPRRIRPKPIGGHQCAIEIEDHRLNHHAFRHGITVTRKAPGSTPEQLIRGLDQALDLHMPEEDLTLSIAADQIPTVGGETQGSVLPDSVVGT
jgi:hypothetical protein